jgi:hypothetical protein
LHLTFPKELKFFYFEIQETHQPPLAPFRVRYCPIHPVIQNICPVFLLPFGMVAFA